MNNILERISNDLRSKVDQNNFNLVLYGRRSPEYHVARIQLNTTLDTLKNCGYIDNYQVIQSDHEDDYKISELRIYMANIRVKITSTDTYEG